MNHEEFVEKWSFETIPQCDDGIALLEHFAETHPDAYRFMRPEDFVDLNNAAFSEIPEWDAFAEHCSNCDRCKRHRVPDPQVQVPRER